MYSIWKRFGLNLRLLLDASLEKRRQDGTTAGRDGWTAGRLDGTASGGSDQRVRNQSTVEDVLAAAAERLGMIVLVTLTSLTSLIPLALGTATDSLFGSIALATAGGTVAGTMAALWIVPAYLVGRSERSGGRPSAGQLSA